MFNTIIIVLFIINNVLIERGKMQYLSCNTYNCAMEAYTKAINPDIDPCEDFYTHVCSNWEKENPIPPDFGHWNQILRLKEETDHKIVKLLREDINCPVITKIKSKLFKFYNACMLWQNDLNEENLIHMMEDLGGFPLIGIPLKQNYNWENSLAKAVVRFNLLNVLLSLDIQKDVTSPSKNIIVLDQTTLAKPKGYFLSSESNNGKFPTYKKKILDFFEQFFQTFKEYSVRSRNLDEMVAFEAQLAEIIDERSKRRDPIKEGKTVVSELQTSIPELDITGFLKEVFSGITFIDNGTEVYVTRTEYFKGLRDIIKNTKHEVIADYIGWRLLTESIDAQNFFAESEENRSAYCSKYMIKYFPLPLQFINLKYSYYYKSEKKMLLSMFRELKAALVVHNMMNSVWLDSSTKYLAMTKLLLMKNGIYDPYVILRRRQFSEDLMNTSGISMFDTVQDVRAKMVLSKLKIIKEKPKLSDVWMQLLDEFNTFYSQISNTLYIPLHLASFPFYREHFPPAVNFAGMGSAMAREMVHSFDLTGSDYDPNGNYHNWWSNDTKTALNKELICFSIQFFIYEEAGISDLSNLLEVVADNVGLKAAYQAYENYVKGCSWCDRSLPGFNYTNKQLFFIAYAYTMCGQHRIDTENYEYSYKGHYNSPKYRVTTTLKNFQKFSEAFMCSVSSAMHFESGCLIH